MTLLSNMKRKRVFIAKILAIALMTYSSMSFAMHGSGSTTLSTDVEGSHDTTSDRRPSKHGLPISISQDEAVALELANQGNHVQLSLRTDSLRRVTITRTRTCSIVFDTIDLLKAENFENGGTLEINLSYISKDRITGYDLQTILQSPHVRSLSLDFFKTIKHPEDFNSLIFIRENNRLISLKLSGPMPLSAFEVLASALSQNTTLQSLDLSGCRITSDKLQALVPALSENTTLRSLNLSRCGIGSFDVTPLEIRPKAHSAVTALARALDTNTGLQKLYLKENHLGPMDVKELALTLERNHTLQELDLSDNHLQKVEFSSSQGCHRSYNVNVVSDAVKDLAHALTINQGLRVLSLANSTIYGEENALALANAFAANNSLTELDLSMCWIGSAAIQALGKTLKENTSLQILKIQGSGFAYVADYEALMDLIRTKPNFKTDLPVINDLNMDLVRKYHN